MALSYKTFNFHFYLGKLLADFFCINFSVFVHFLSILFNMLLKNLVGINIVYCCLKIVFS